MTNGRDSGGGALDSGDVENPVIRGGDVDPEDSDDIFDEIPDVPVPARSRFAPPERDASPTRDASRARDLPASERPTDGGADVSEPVQSADVQSAGVDSQWGFRWGLKPRTPQVAEAEASAPSPFAPRQDAAPADAQPANLKPADVQPADVPVAEGQTPAVEPTGGPVGAGSTAVGAAAAASAFAPKPWTPDDVPGDSRATDSASTDSASTDEPIPRSDEPEAEPLQAQRRFYPPPLVTTGSADLVPPLVEPTVPAPFDGSLLGTPPLEPITQGDSAPTGAAASDPLEPSSVRPDSGQYDSATDSVTDPALTDSAQPAPATGEGSATPDSASELLPPPLSMDEVLNAPSPRRAAREAAAREAAIRQQENQAAGYEPDLNSLSDADPSASDDGGWGGTAPASTDDVSNDLDDDDLDDDDDGGWGDDSPAADASPASGPGVFGLAPATPLSPVPATDTAGSSSGDTGSRSDSDDVPDIERLFQPPLPASTERVTAPSLTPAVGIAPTGAVPAADSGGRQPLSRSFKIALWILSIIVVGCLLALALVVAQRLGSQAALGKEAETSAAELAATAPPTDDDSAEESVVEDAPAENLPAEEAAAEPAPSTASSAAAEVATQLASVPGVTAAPGPQRWTDLGGGECIGSWQSAWAEQFEVVDCAAPHPAQLVAIGQFDPAVTAGYPGVEQLQARVAKVCGTPSVINFGALTGISDVVIQAAFAPTEQQWAAQEYGFACFVTRSSGELFTGSVAQAPTVALLGA